MLHNACNTLLLSFLLLAQDKALPEVICTLGPDSSSYNAYVDQRPTIDAMQLVDRVGSALKAVCTPNCLTVAIFRNATAPNAVLMVDSDRLKMAYSPQFFTAVYEKHGDGAIIAIVGHMLGHAIDATAHAAWMNSSWPPELCADAWAGCALAQANLSSAGLKSALTTLSMYPSSSHPGWPRRVPPLRLGYTQCGGDGTKFDLSAKGMPKN